MKSHRALALSLSGLFTLNPGCSTDSDSSDSTDAAINDTDDNSSEEGSSDDTDDDSSDDTDDDTATDDDYESDGDGSDTDAASEADASSSSSDSGTSTGSDTSAADAGSESTGDASVVSDAGMTSDGGVECIGSNRDQAGDFSLCSQFSPCPSSSDLLRTCTRYWGALSEEALIAIFLCHSGHGFTEETICSAESEAAYTECSDAVTTQGCLLAAPECGEVNALCEAVTVERCEQDFAGMNQGRIDFVLNWYKTEIGLQLIDGGPAPADAGVVDCEAAWETSLGRF